MLYYIISKIKINTWWSKVNEFLFLLLWQTKKKTVPNYRIHTRTHTQCLSQIWEKDIDCGNLHKSFGDLVQMKEWKRCDEVSINRTCTCRTCSITKSDSHWEISLSNMFSAFSITLARFLLHIYYHSFVRHFKRISDETNASICSCQKNHKKQKPQKW